MGKRNRTTWRLTDENYDYILRQSKQMGMSANDVINIIVGSALAWDFEYHKRKGDSRVTAPSSPSQ